MKKHEAECIRCGRVYSMRLGAPSILNRLYCPQCRPKEERKPKTPRQTSSLKVDNDYHGSYTE